MTYSEVCYSRLCGHSSLFLLINVLISVQMGNYLHYLSTFIGGFAVAFSGLYKLALLTLAVVPLIAIAGVLYTLALTGLTSQGQAAYSKAGIIAEQVRMCLEVYLSCKCSWLLQLKHECITFRSDSASDIICEMLARLQAVSQVRTVYAFVGESKTLQSYTTALRANRALGYKGGMAKGLGIGVTYGLLYGAWALLLWFGGVLVRKGDGNGGKVLSTIFAVIIGGM